MTIMLPTASRYAGSLTDVVPSSLAALGVEGFENRLAIAPARSIVVVLVDGLGQFNLSEASGHARYLTNSRHDRRELLTVFPSTTAAALISLMTGEHPGHHGVAGYKLRDPQSNQMVNQLTELDAVDDSWMRCHTLAERVSTSAQVFIVGRAKFATSPMTRTAYRGATYVSADSLDERVDRAIDLTARPGRLIVMYISELDSIAHKHGVESFQWRAGLEDVDAALKSLREKTPSDVGVVVTADHGIVDVDRSNHIVLNDEALLSHVAGIGGEPRCVQVHLDDAVDQTKRHDVAELWQRHVGDRINVLTRQAVLSSGILGDIRVHEEVQSRLGDLFLLAEGSVVVYDGRDENRAPQRMVGQHGALSEREMVIPLIQLK